MSTLNEQTIIITATVAPLKGGKRAVLVSAAPDGELPVILSGNFADLKNLFDEAWLALLKREPVVVPDKARKGEAEKPAPNKDAAPETDNADDGANETPESDDTNTPDEIIDQMTAVDRDGNPIPLAVAAAEIEPAPDQLVRIENDPTDAQPTLF